MDYPLLRRLRPGPLDAPRRARRFEAHYDPDAFGRFSEGIARFFGTARYLVVQTILVIVWIRSTWSPSACAGIPTRSSC